MSEVTLIDGKPAAKISVTLSEKIGLPNYSSVDVGPITISRFVEDGDNDHLLKEVRNTASIVEEFLAEERAAVLESLKSS